MSTPPCLGCQSDAQPVECGKSSVNAFASAVVLFAFDPTQVMLYLGGMCPAHYALAERVIVWMAKQNGKSPEELVARLKATYGVDIQHLGTG